MLTLPEKPLAQKIVPSASINEYNYLPMQCL